MKPIKRLTPLSKMVEFNDESNLKNVVESLSQTLSVFSSELRSLIQDSSNLKNSQVQDPEEISKNFETQSIYQLKREPRFQNLLIDIPQLCNNDDFKRKAEIQNWLGFSWKQILSAGFALYHGGQLDFRKCTIYCCEEILCHLVQFIKKNNLKQKQLEHINEALAQRLIPYLLMKYPLSEEAEVSLSFAKQIIEKNNIEDHENDLVYRSGVKFPYTKNRVYNSYIMEFLNNIISLPNKINEDQDPLFELLSMKLINKEGNQNKPSKKLGELFFEDIESIFKKVYTLQETIKMKKFNPQFPGQKIKEDKADDIEETQKEKEEYELKVKSYTHYLIGRKLSENTPNFNKSEIRSGSLRLNNSALMRIVTKWCEQLSKCFDSKSIVDREHQFRMRNGSQKFLPKTELRLLAKILAFHKKKIEQFMKDMMQNNYLSQSEFGKSSVSQEFKIFSEKEAMVGQFAAVMFSNSETYITGYLNQLIHGITAGLRDYEQIVKVLNYFDKDHAIKKKVDLVCNDKLDVEKLIKQVFQKNCEVDADSLAALVPELITFKIGDLLRCKCSSHQNQIFAIYREIERISYESPKLLKIVRLKNRLDKGTKDILMNLLYRDTILVEIQLSINMDKSKFLDCSSKFNHYIYELRRSELGPISELCNIWINKDYRSQFYLEKVEKKNKREKTKEEKSSEQEKVIKKCEHHNGSQITLPFRCSRCSYYYKECNMIENHIICTACGKFVCLPCRLETASRNELMKILPELQRLKKMYSPHHEITKSQGIPDGGLLLNLKSKERKPKFFKLINYNKKKYLFGFEKSLTGQLVLKVVSSFVQSKAAAFDRENIIFVSQDQQFKKNIPNISNQMAKFEYFIPNYLETCFNTHQSSLALIDMNMNESIFKKSKQIEKWVHATQINFSENSFGKVSDLFFRFPNAEIIVLSNSKIQSIEMPSYEWNKAKFLDLSINNLKEIPKSLTSLSSLENLNLMKNKIKQIPISLFDLKFYPIKTLNLSCNQIQSLPPSISSLVELKNLVLNQNWLEVIPEEIGDLEKLEELSIERNYLSKIPDSITKLEKLKFLSLFMNQIKKLPDEFGKLNSLEKLYVDNNQLKSLPQSIGKLTKLIKFFANNNLLESLPETIGNLSSLQKFFLFINNLSSLPSTFANLSSLSELHIYQNKLQSLPDNFGSLFKLFKLNANKNKLTALPDSFCSLASLEQMEIKENEITCLPENIGNLSRLEVMNFNQNQIHSLPQSIGNLQSLQNLYLSHNQISELPESIVNLTFLQVFNCDGNKLQRFPQDFDEMTSLEYLDFSDNQITEIPQQIGNLPNLQKIKLVNNCITVIPPTITSLHKLTELTIYQNRIQLLPEDIGELSQLVFLNLENNLLEELPASINKLKKLKVLGLRYNRVNHIKREIGQLESLEVLQLSANRINEGVLPQDFCRLENLKNFDVKGCGLGDDCLQMMKSWKKLQYIYLSGNNFTYIPKFISDFPNLKQLLFDQNPVDTIEPRAIPASLECLLLQKTKISSLTLEDFACSIPESKLKVLAVSNTKIKDISALSGLKFLHYLDIRNLDLSTMEIFPALPSLSIVQMTNCALKSLPSNLFENSLNLTRIQADENQIQSLPEEISLPQNLNVMQLKNNKISILPSEISLPHLQFLQLQNNPIQNLPHKFDCPSLKSFTLENAALQSQQSLPDTFFNNLPELTDLSLLNIPALTKIPQTIQNLPNLMNVFVTDCAIEQIHDSLFKVPYLITLSLDGNKIKQLPDSVGLAINLQSLSISNNLLQDLPQTLQNLQNLKILIVRNNQIKALPQCVNSMKNLIALAISKNKVETINEQISSASFVHFCIGGNPLSYISLEILKMNNLQRMFIDQAFMENFQELIEQLRERNVQLVLDPDR